MVGPCEYGYEPAGSLKAEHSLTAELHINLLKPEADLKIFNNSARTAKKTPHFTNTKINWLMLFKEIAAFVFTLLTPGVERYSLRGGGVCSPQTSCSGYKIEMCNLFSFKLASVLSSLPIHDIARPWEQQVRSLAGCAGVAHRRRAVKPALTLSLENKMCRSL
jgi:hypothetical protein